MASKQELKARVSELEEKVGEYLDKIEERESTIMRLEQLMNDQNDAEDGEKDTKHAYELDEKDKKIRELKDKLSYLRKEKINLQQELEAKEKETQEANKQSVGKSKSPLNSLVNELQTKINNCISRI